MTTKLTLTIEESVMKSAKKYAASNGKSLSDIVEAYFKKLPSNKKNRKEQFSPIIKELLGSVTLPNDFNYKDTLSKELTKKYQSQ